MAKNMKKILLLLALLLPLCLRAESPFVAGKDWLPFPAYSDRAAWAELFGPKRAFFIRRGEEALKHNWTHIPASAYLAYEKSGDRQVMSRLEGGNRSAMISLLVAELAEGKGRFIPHLADGAWFAAEQTSWVLSAHQVRQRSQRALPDAREQLIDLASGRFGSIMVLTWHFFREEFDRIDPSISAAMERAVKRNILDCFLDENEHAANWWMGIGSSHRVLNNWTPWCTSDVLLAFLVMEKDQARLDEAIRLGQGAIDAWLGYISKDGACEEGPGYWNAAAGKLFDLIQMFQDASGGACDLSTNPRYRRMGEFISRAYAGGGWVFNFADGSPRLSTSPGEIWRYGKLLGSREMMDFGLSVLPQKDGRFRMPPFTLNDSYRALEGIRRRPELSAAVDSLNALAASQGTAAVVEHLRRSVPTASWYPETEQCYLRNDLGWAFAAKGGFNDESHNHNDIGSCILYVDNSPVLIDAGVGTYTRDTFGKNRYSLWTMQGQWHNLPMPNGVEQRYGRQYKARDARCDARKGVFSLQLAEAYPEEAALSSLERRYQLSMKGKASLRITDRYQLRERKAADVVHFLIRGQVRLLGKGELVITPEGGAPLRLRFPKEMTASVEEKKLDDPRLSGAWGPSLQRITLSGSDKAPLSGSYTYSLEAF